MITKGPSRVMIVLVASMIAVFCGAYYEVLDCTKLFTHDSIIWFGTYHYYVSSLLGGHFPYWDPYLQGGTYFYPNISLLGLLDPAVLVSALVVKLFGLSLLTGYVIFYLSRLVLFAVGSYVLFRHISGCGKSAVLSAGILVLALTPSYFRQPGAVDLIYLTPLACYCLLRLIEDPKGPRRYLYIAAFALITGITMNVFIPSYYLFNLLVVLAVLLILRFTTPRDIVRVFREPRFLLAFLLASVLVLMMTAPPLMVMFRDAGMGGELFPMVRIVQKNDGLLKKIDASEIGSEAVSNRFTGQQGVFSSYGNFLNMVYPDIFESVPYFANDLLSEIPQYVGVIPFFIALIGMLYHASRYRLMGIVMMVVMTINMFSFAGMSGKPFNILQQAFNFLFPPLKVIEVREVFGAFFLLYFCLQMSLGFSILFDGDRLRDVIRAHARSISGMAAVVVLVKIVITAYYANKVIVASWIDAFVLLQIALGAVAVWLHQRGRLKSTILQVGLVCVVLADLAVYSAYNAHYVLADSTPFYEIADVNAKAANPEPFQYFKEPFVSPAGVAFGESIMRVKGVLTTGNNHSIFTTKRYYDLLAFVPPQNHLALAGAVFPVLRFLPDDGQARMVADRKQLLGYLATAGEQDLLGGLFLEHGRAQERPSAMGDLRSYENVETYFPPNLFSFLGVYRDQRGAFINEVRQNARSFLRTSEYSMQVRSSSNNEVSIDVQNGRPGYLLYNDSWSRYWRAFDNGQEVPVLIANYNSKAVYLQPGQHVIRFVFDPQHYKFGLVLYYSGLLITTALIAILWYRTRGRSSPTSG